MGSDRSCESISAGSLDMRLKRLIDISVAIPFLFLAFIPGVALAVAIRLGSPGPALYRQTRIGRGGDEFTILKFRTMRVDPQWNRASGLPADPDHQPQWAEYQKMYDDPRLTRLGRFLRHYSIDEIPQLVNVLRGEMSLVGPRPCLPEQRVFYGVHYRDYTAVRPGLTGLWQVSGRNRLSFSERVRLDSIYVRTWSQRQDLWIMWRTIGVVLSGHGAF